MAYYFPCMLGERINGLMLRSRVQGGIDPYSAPSHYSSLPPLKRRTHDLRRYPGTHVGGVEHVKGVCPQYQCTPVYCGQTPFTTAPNDFTAAPNKTHLNPRLPLALPSQILQSISILPMHRTQLVHTHPPPAQTNPNSHIPALPPCRIPK